MKFLDKIKSSKVKYVVECASIQNKYTYALTEATLVSEELLIQKQIVGNSIKDFSEIVVKKPITLIVNTNKVLTRKVSKNIKANQLLSEAFPNLILEDFYYQIHDSKNDAFVSVVRKEYVHGLIANFENHKITITNFVIGSINIFGVLKYINTNEVNTLSHKIECDKGEIVQIQPNTENSENIYTLESQEIKSSHLLGISVLINQLSGFTYGSNTKEKNQELKKSYSESQFFKNTLIYGVGVLLCILLGNAFIFNRKFSQIQLLQEEEQVFNNHKKQLEEKRALIKNKEGIVQSIINTGFSKSSFYINQIIQILPNSILLKQYTYQPLVRSVKKNKKVEVKKSTITIKGGSNNKKEFNRWLQQLEDFNFVTNIVIEEYGVVKGTTANFEIHLNLLIE